MTTIFYTRANMLQRLVLLLSFMLTLGAVPLAGTAEAASKEKIDRRVTDTLKEFKEKIRGGNDLLNRAAGVLIFPSVKKAGIGIGGEYGEGALQINGKTVDYYSTAAASVGFQLGAQARAQILVFLDKNALIKFRSSDGWEIGVDGSVALITIGAGGSLDSTRLDEPIIGFIFNNKGLMYNLSLEGSKMTKIER